MAAAYGFGLATNHPFRDGNKRVAFLAMVTFLGLNKERRLAEWVRAHLAPPGEP